ncbi:MAG: ABC transporter permease [Hyphomicrobiaceae bacterium]
MPGKPSPIMKTGLGGYILSRIATLGIVILGAMTTLFFLTQLVPGNLAQVLLGPRATPAQVEAFAERMGLDQPVYVRLWRFFFQVAQGDLGHDIVTGRPILDMVLEVLPNTVALAFAAIGLGLLIGVPLGIYAATYRGSRGDQLTAILSVSIIATPTFVVAIYLLLIFSIWLHWLPVIGAGEPGNLVDQLVHLILPATAIALGWIGYIARLMRASMLEVLDEPHIRTLRAYGVSSRRILWKYALKIAAIPTLAVVGLGIGDLLAGAIFVEIIFARPGIGSIIYQAINNRNYPVVQGGVLVVVLMFVISNLIVDLLYAWLDPRIRRSLAEAGPS